MERDGTYFNVGDHRLSQINGEYAFRNQNKEGFYQAGGFAKSSRSYTIEWSGSKQVKINGP